MNGKKKSIWWHRAMVGLVTLLTVALLVPLVGCERPKKSKSTGLPTAAPATATASSPAAVSASPTTVSTVEETPTSGLEAPSPTIAPQEATPTLPPAATDTPASPGALTYTVQSGDTLYSIALRYNMTVDALMAANDITDAGALTVGQQLIIPTGQEMPTPPTPGEETVHVVQKGEWLYSIARQYGTTAQAIANRNGIVNPSLIRPGQRLIIPVEGGAPSAPGKIHTVQRGENLFRIALRYSTTVQAIMQANHLASTVIYPGQQLRIP